MSQKYTLIGFQAKTGQNQHLYEGEGGNHIYKNCSGYSETHHNVLVVTLQTSKKYEIIFFPFFIVSVHDFRKTLFLNFLNFD